MKSEHARTVEMLAQISSLGQPEQRQLEKAAHGDYEGGDVVANPLRQKVAEIDLVYKSSGRLRTCVYKLLRGDDATVVNKNTFLARRE